VQLELSSPDVIHSFWIPNLIAKHDAVPGYTVTTFLRADKPGAYVGQCAEFCGYQHANMRFTVTAESPEKFAVWLSSQRQPPPPPKTPSQKRGQQVFFGASCSMCHTIAGTPARATVGPNLSHIASRPTIGAGALPNNRGNLAGWILDPQRVKPGTRMPQNNLAPADLQALLDYLETLK
jgi:cytochrome c oxidase subunit 2